MEMRPAIPSDPALTSAPAAVLAGAGIPSGQGKYAQARARTTGFLPDGKQVHEAAISDTVYRQPSNRLLGARQGSVGKNFCYLFTWRSPAMGGKLGSCKALGSLSYFANLACRRRSSSHRERLPWV